MASTRMLRLNFMQGIVFLMIASAVTPNRLENQRISTTGSRPGNYTGTKCDAIHHLCHYPHVCMCFWHLRLGPWRNDWYHFNSLTHHCDPGAESFNCNGFSSYDECNKRCHFSKNSTRRKKRH
ncbi:uncharacterized protein LOC119402753 [Rhipicephalus sanguineus]|uniref:uncharacterized protein LOC119402753 n=1 Tax=Rhipicephalus sanguineus TaxID=34632 RepID=UPI001893B2B3|nr:uncharacterized protein LOC119402753 [Rhipicephalus sanguineus]